MNELMNLDVMEVFVDTDKQIKPNMNKREHMYTPTKLWNLIIIRCHM